MERFVAESKRLFKLGGPVVMTYLASFTLPLVTVIFVGQRMTRTDLAGVALGHLTFNVTGASVMIGLLSGLDTLSAALVICFVAFIFVAVLWLSGIKSLLHILRQEDDVAALAQRYTRLMLLGLVPLTMFEAFKRFLQTQNVVRPMLYVALAVIPPHILFCYIFVGDEGIAGFDGAALSNSLSFWLMFALLLMYLVYFKPHHPESFPSSIWSSSSSSSLSSSEIYPQRNGKGFSRLENKNDDDEEEEVAVEVTSSDRTLVRLCVEALDWNGVKSFLKLGTPGLVMLCLEWWSFEVLALAAGYMSTAALAAHTILAQIIPLAFMVPLGIGTAASVRIGNELGAEQPNEAKFSALVSIVITIIFSFCTSIIFGVFARPITSVFSSDSDVVDLSTKASPIVAAFMVLDYFQGVSQGIARGAGCQSQGALIVLLGSWFVGIPLGFTFGLVKDASDSLGIGQNPIIENDEDEHGGSLFGLWLGMFIGYLVIDALFARLFIRMNWEELCTSAKKNSTTTTTTTNVTTSRNNTKSNSTSEQHEEEEEEHGDVEMSLVT